MDAEQKTEEVKSTLPVLITPQLLQLKINGELSKQKLSMVELERRALSLVKNEDNLKLMADMLKDLKTIDDLAETVHKNVKQPYWDAGKACDAGKKLVLDSTAAIRATFEPQYKKLLDGIATRKRLSDAKIATDAGILKAIEDNVIAFSNMVVAATTLKALSAAESRINLEKSPSMRKKYGEFDQKAVDRYDAVLIPIIRDQKKKVEELEDLNRKLLEAEANNDPDSMDILMEKVDEKSNEILQNHAVIQEAALIQDSFPVVEATEVLPSFKVKRTNFSFEIADLEVAIKKARGLLDITVNNVAAREVLEGLKGKNAFEGKDEVIVDGIKYIATRVREAL